MIKNNLDYERKLIEVALPLDIINKASSSEKSVRQGHPSTLHLWWARRPLAACRAVIFASIINDPSNYYDEEKANKERKKLFQQIELLVEWKNTNNKDLIDKIKTQLKKAYPKDLPPIYDPFCGGGSIPLEAQRLGLPAFASDLNPIPVLINKAMIEYPPLFSDKSSINPSKLSDESNENLNGLANDVKYYGELLANKALNKIGKYYKKYNDKTVVAWIWSRTVICPNPACGLEVPLARSYKVSKNDKLKNFIQPYYENNKLKFKMENSLNFEKKHSRLGINCINCGTSISLDHIRKEANNGRLNKRLMSIITRSKRGFEFYSPTNEHENLDINLDNIWVPDFKLIGKTTVSVPLYGMHEHKDLYTKRQLLALSTFSSLIPEIHDRIIEDAEKSDFTEDNRSLEDGGRGKRAYADLICTYLSFAIDRCADYWSTFAIWANSFVAHTFGRQAIPMIWDFAEVNPFSSSTGNWLGAVDWITKCITTSLPGKGEGKAIQLDASSNFFPDITPIVCTDPPYYDNICYADLSDYFYVWLRHSLKDIYPELFSTLLTPKNQEMIASPYIHKGDMKKANEHFVNNFKKSFALIRENMHNDFPLTIFYAFKQSEKGKTKSGESAFASTGWETMLEALISGGFVITGTWPIRTERSSRPVGLRTNALASSIVLVCRPRNKNTSVTTRREFINTLSRELPSALNNLQNVGIAPVDIAQSSIGPGMAIFSRYEKILEADGTQMSVKTALQIINQQLDNYFVEQESDMDPETRFCISWYTQFGWKEGPFGDANTLATAKGTAVDALEKTGILYAKAGKVRLLHRDELDDNWDPIKKRRVTIWECVQYLIKSLEEEGESGSALLMKKIGGVAESVKELSYRLYSLCEKNNWAEDAVAYNSLISSWRSIADKSQFGERISKESKRSLKDKSQKTLFENDGE
jgi:putative DNA methylase